MIRYFKFVFLILSICLVFILIIAKIGFSQKYPPDISRIINKKVLVVAIFKNDLAPFFAKDSKTGKLYGIDIDLAKDIAKQLGVKLKIIRIGNTFDNVVNAVAERKADIAISCLSITLKRALKVNFTQPYVYLHHALLINRLKAPQNFSNLNWINSPKTIIGVMNGTSYVEFAKSDYPNAKIKKYNSWHKLTQDILKGKVTVILYDEIEISRWMYTHPEEIFYVRKKILWNKVDSIAIAVNWKDIHLLSWLNIYLSMIKKNGKLKKIIHKYYKNTIGAFK